MIKFLGERASARMRGALGEYFSDDEIDVYFAAMNSAEVFAHEALTGYENIIANYFGTDDTPTPYVAYEMADSMIEIAVDAPRHALDFGRIIGRNARYVLGMCEQAHSDLDGYLRGKFGRVPDMIEKRVGEQKETGTYRPVYETNAY